MKKFRIVPSLLYKNFSVVKSVGFKNHRTVGDLASTIKVFSRRQADELIVYNLDSSRSGAIDWGMIETCVANANMPLCYGGGVSSQYIAAALVNSGVDKISFNTNYFQSPDLIYKSAQLIGSSSTVLSLNLVQKNGNLCLYSHSDGTAYRIFDMEIEMPRIINLGVGELVLNFVDHDGTMEGYNWDGISENIFNFGIPVLIAGGCSGYNCLIRAFNFGFDGAALSSIFFWQGDSVASLKKELGDVIPVRALIE